MTDSPIFDALLDERWATLPPKTVVHWLIDRVIVRHPIGFTVYSQPTLLSRRLFAPVPPASITKDVAL